MVEAADRAVITFEGINKQPLILYKDVIEKTHQAILDKYGIPEDRYLREGE